MDYVSLLHNVDKKFASTIAALHVDIVFKLNALCYFYIIYFYQNYQNI